MKKYIYLLFLLFPFFYLSSQDYINEIDVLIETKQYKKAFEKTRELISTNSDPLIVAKNVEICMNYFSRMQDYSIFAFSDLTQGVSLEDARNGNIVHAMIKWDLVEVINNSLVENPTSGLLYKLLGDFYNAIRFETQNNYYTEIAYDAYAEALKLNYTSWDLFAAVGELSIYTGRITESIELLQRSIELKPDYPTSYYNLAHVFLRQSEYAKSIENFRKALNRYDNLQYKMDCYLYIALSYFQQSNYDLAEKTLLEAHQFMPKNFEPYLNLVAIFLLNENYEKAYAYTEKLFLLDPAEPKYLLEIYALYAENNEFEKLENFLLSQVDKVLTNKKAVGNLYSYLIKFYKEIGNFDMLKEYEEKKRTVLE